MTSPRQEQATHRLMEDLLDCPSAQQRCAILLDALLREKLCLSAAVWRHVGSGPVRAWHPLLARGAAGLLPTLDMVRSVVAGELPQELTGGRAVILPIGHRTYALAVGVGHAPSATHEEDLDTIDALFHVWMAVEVAESVGQADNLLDALPSLASAPAQPAQSPPLWFGWQSYLRREADLVLDPACQLELECEALPEGRFDEDALRLILRELLASSAAGFERAPTRLAIKLEHLASRGVRIELRDNGGRIPSLFNAQCGRFSGGLFDASKVLQQHGGDFTIEAHERGGNRVSAFLPDCI